MRGEKRFPKYIICTTRNQKPEPHLPVKIKSDLLLVEIIIQRIPHFLITHLLISYFERTITKLQQDGLNYWLQLLKNSPMLSSISSLDKVYMNEL